MADAELVFAALEHVLSVEDLERLVLALVDVQRRVQQRRQLLPDGQ